MNFITDRKTKQSNRREKKERKKEREMDRVKIENTANSILPKPQYA